MAILYYYWADENSEITPIYDPDRYELVEKKDWKINNLKEQIEENKELLRGNSDAINYYQKLETEYANKILNLEKELKELEKE